jgi:CheY-like chemotaxis protein
MSGALSRSREIRAETDRRGNSLSCLRDRRQDLDRRLLRHSGRATQTLVLRELGARFRDDPTMPEGRSTSEGRILVVDDESAIRLICRVNLNSAGFKTLEAGDGETGVSLAHSEQPDLILLDIMLPGMDGLKVAERLSAAPETREIPIIFLTARSTAPDELRGHEAGGVAYIAKPFDPTFLTETVAAVLRRTRRGERDELRREWGQSLSTD